MATALEDLASAVCRLACAENDLRSTRELLAGVSPRLAEASDAAYGELTALQVRVTFAFDELAGGGA
ncbi:MAG: hypothetical protein ACRCYU_03315 [Nocardioides sp.]